jgi:hypothetical protein
MASLDAMQHVEDVLGEFDLGVEFIAKEVESSAGTQWVEAYVAGMVEEAVRQLLTLTDAAERMEMVGEVQQMVLRTAVELGEEEGE